MKSLALLLGAAFLTGCSSVPRDAGFGEVEKAVALRTGHPVVLQTSGEAPTSDDAVRPLLDGKLTADRAVEIALRNNRDLQAELAELGVARADLIEAITVRNPILDGEIRFPGDPKNPFEIAVTQTLFDLFRLPARRRFGLALFEASKLRVTGAVVHFAAEVRSDYYDLQAARLVLARQRVITDAAAASTDLARRQHTAGNISDLDLENEQAVYEQAKLDLARAELEELQTRERVISDLGLVDSTTTLDLPDEFAPIPEQEIALEGIEDKALSDRLDLQVTRREIEAAERQGPLARWEVWDEVTVGVHREREPEGRSTTGPALSIPIPIFNRGEARRARAAALLRQAQQRYAALTVNARSEVRSARERLLEARARAQYLRDVIVPRRARILALTQLEYNAMLRGVFELIRARQNLASAERELVLGQRDYWIARSDLDTALAGVSGFSARREAPGFMRLDLFRPSTQAQSQPHE
ncbi:MAG TPA: TolC family protein [Thermoanaerobaculia bacterium]|nr:TolC family protein [Thermoanaerobaculia bacterium]